MYTLIRNFLFRFDAERVHHFSMAVLRLLCLFPPTRWLLRFLFYPKQAKSVSMGPLTFRNGVILAAGFDKNGTYLSVMNTLGFGAVEIGTVTPRSQPGNPKPRVFRLPTDQALINRMGFNNDGIDQVVQRLRAWRQVHPVGAGGMLIGGNLGKNKDTPNELAASDYVAGYVALHPWVDFFTINVSSPNTPGLRALQDKAQLALIFEALRATQLHQRMPKPIWLKIAPDLTEEQLLDVVELARSYQLEGLVATNTTISRAGLTASPQRIDEIGAGGLSGRPLFTSSTAVLQFLATHLQGAVPLIASGGILTREDAAAKQRAGAQLIQVWTGFIYRGPRIIREIAESF